IDQLVREMHPTPRGRGLDRLTEMHTCRVLLQSRRLSFAKALSGLDDRIARACEALWRLHRQRLQNVVRESPVVRALFHEVELVRAPQTLPHLRELPREQSPEERTHTHAGEEVAVSSDC